MFDAKRKGKRRIRGRGSRDLLPCKNPEGKEKAGGKGESTGGSTHLLKKKRGPVRWREEGDRVGFIFPKNSRAGEGGE